MDLSIQTSSRTEPGPPGPPSAELHDPSALSAELIREWQKLDADAADANPFFLSWFLRPALRHLDPGGRVSLLAIRDGGGTLDGVVPVTAEIGYCKLPLRMACVWQHEHCWNGTPLMRRGREAAVLDALLDWVDRRPFGARFLRFPNLPFGDGERSRLADACRRAGRAYRVQSLHERAVLAPDIGYEPMMAAAMSGKKRKELRRQARRFEEMGTVAWEELDPARPAVLDAFLALENAGWKAAEPGGMPLARSLPEATFFRDAMRGGAAAGAVRCLALTLDGRPVAMLFLLVAGGRVSAFKTSYDESFAAWSNGRRLMIEASRRFLAGEWGAHDPCIFDSCAREGHPVVDALWPGRLPVAQVNVPASGVDDRALLALAARMERTKLAALRAVGR